MPGINEAEIRCRIINNQFCWLVRDVGKLLGYGSNGGNLSRNLNSTWSEFYREGVHYFSRPTTRNQKAHWAPTKTVLSFLNRTVLVHPQRAKAALDFTSLLPRDKRSVFYPTGKKTEAPMIRRQPKGSIWYRGQLGRIKDTIFIFTPDSVDILKYKQRSYANLKEMSVAKLTDYQRAARELIMHNRREALRGRKMHVHDHLAFACTRVGKNKQRVAMKWQAKHQGHPWPQKLRKPTR